MKGWRIRTAGLQRKAWIMWLKWSWVRTDKALSLQKDEEGEIRWALRARQGECLDMEERVNRWGRREVGEMNEWGSEWVKRMVGGVSARQREGVNQREGYKFPSENGICHADFLLLSDSTSPCFLSIYFNKNGITVFPHPHRHHPDLRPVWKRNVCLRPPLCPHWVLIMLNSSSNQKEKITSLFHLSLQEISINLLVFWGFFLMGATTKHLGPEVKSIFLIWGSERQRLIANPEITWAHYQKSNNKHNDQFSQELYIRITRSQALNNIPLSKRGSFKTWGIQTIPPCYFSPSVTPYFIAFSPHTGSTAWFPSQQVQYDLKRYTPWNPWIVRSSGPPHFLLNFMWFIYLFGQFGQDSHEPLLWWG